MGKKLVFCMIVAVIVTLLWSNCGGGRSDTIRISGAWALYPMMQVWADEYRRIKPVDIEVGGGGAGKGMSDVLNGQVDIAMCSRPIREEEMKLGAFYLAVTKDAVIALVNAENPVLPQLMSRGLSRETLKAVFMKKVLRWGEVGHRELTGDSIVVYGRADASGAAQVWARFLGDYSQSDIQDQADANFSGDQALCNGIKNNRNAIGFCNINYAYNIEDDGYADGIRPVPVDLDENGILDPDENFYANRSLLVQNITLGVYPSPPARLEYLVSRGPFSPTAREFVRWILTDGQAFVSGNGYVNLPAVQLQQEIEYLQKGARHR